jgi:ABC-type Na+ efflux pump permease subunit
VLDLAGNGPSQGCHVTADGNVDSVGVEVGAPMKGDPLLFAAAVVVFAITLVGFGLLLGALCRTVAQLNNWSSIPLLLLLMPVFFASLALPSIVRAILDALPSVQAVRLLIDSLSAKSVYGNWLISFAIMAAWAVVGYGLLIRSLARREA